MQTTINAFSKILSAEEELDAYSLAKNLLTAMAVDKVSYADAMHVIKNVRSVMHDAEHLLAKAAMYELTREHRSVNLSVLENMRDEYDAKY
ncbi:MAG: hypothetical protein [Podoviridae sp. ctLUJ1]|nr:MAG: hypothetical protein [Podoviridae sp. ctLUJ1]